MCVCLSSCWLLGTTGSGISRGAKTIKAIEPMPTPISESPQGIPEVSKEVEIIISCSSKFHLSNRKFFLIWKENRAPWLSISCFPVCVWEPYNLCLSHWFGIFVGEHGYKNEAIQDLFPQLLWLFPNHITLLAPRAFVTNLKSILLGFSNRRFCQATHSAYVMLSLWIHKMYPIKSPSWEMGEVRSSRPILHPPLARWLCNSQGRTSHPSSSLLLSGPARPKPVSRRQGCSKEHEERELCRKRGPCQHECSQQPSGRTAGPLCWSQGW